MYDSADPAYTEPFPTVSAHSHHPAPICQGLPYATDQAGSLLKLKKAVQAPQYTS